MNKISKICFMLIGGLLSLAIPAYLGIDSFLCHEKKIAPAKAAISELASTNITLTPVTNADVKTLADGSHYVMAVVNEINDGNTLYEGALYAHSGGYYCEISFPINNDLSIDVDNNLAAIIASIIEFRAPDSDTFDIINKSAYRYLGAEFNSYDSSWYFYSGVEKPAIVFEFSQNSDQKSYTVSTTVESGGNPVTGYVHYNSERLLKIDSTGSSKVCIYRLPSGFYETYSWVPKFNAISSTDNADDLLEMWQNLPIYEKENIFENFFPGDSDDSGSQAGHDYTTYSSDLAAELINLQDKYNLYATVVGAEYERPFACKNVDENIVIDNSTGTISGFSSINRLFYGIDEGYGEIFYSSFDINPSGVYTFTSYNSDGISIDFIGKTVYFCYSVQNYSKPLSMEPYVVTFANKQNIGPLPDEGPTPYPLTYYVNTSTGDTSTVEYNFADSFKLESMPEGYDIALATESFYNTYSAILEGTSEDTFPSNLVSYHTQNEPFTGAYDEHGELHLLEPSTTYYLLYRLSATTDSLFSDCCGYKTYTTGTEPSYLYLAKAESYDNYVSLKNSERFSTYLANCESYYDATYNTFDYELNQLEEQVQYDEYVAAMSISDRWYVEASKIMLLNSYYISEHSSSRILNIVETLTTGLNNIVDNSNPINREAIDAYVDANMDSFEEQYVLYATQEEAAKRMADYFNELIEYYLFSNSLTDAIAILKTYCQDVYASDNSNDIYTYEMNFRSEIKEWFIENSNGAIVNNG